MQAIYSLTWFDNLDNANEAIVGTLPEHSRVVYSDASNTGFGGYVVELGNDRAQGSWDSSQSKKSSAWRELSAVDLVLRSFVSKLSNRRTKWFTDNQSVARIAAHGSMNPELQEIALSICQTCLKNNIHIDMEWIPRSQNQKADMLSRQMDRDDWGISDQVFSFFDELWGPHTVDRFASYYNKKVARFNSRYHNPGCEAVDAFTVDWKEDNNWVVPPIFLIPRVIKHMESTKAVGTLICPCWYSAPYWPILFPDGYNPGKAVQQVYEIPRNWSIFVPGRGGNVEFIDNITRSKILAIRLDFSSVRT